MGILQPKRVAWLGTLVVSLGVGVAAQEQKPAQQAPATELQTLLKERQAALAKLVTALTACYQAGTVDFGVVARAERDFLNATVELDDAPGKRLAALGKFRDSAKTLVKIAEARAKTGHGSETDVLQATAVLLEARIALLREELKQRPSK
jgi:outer membrane protein TolC